MDYRAEIAAKMADRINEVYGVRPDGLATFLETPPDPEMGDFAFPCFRLSKQLKAAPPVIAAKLTESPLADATFDKVVAVGGYINWYVNKAGYAKEILGKVQAQGEGYGSDTVGIGKTILIDYSSINIAKRFHLGHLSTTMIGNALYKIYSFLGYKCVGINHLGDWGTQFGKMIAAYLKWGSKEQVEQGGVAALVELYVRFHKEAEKDPSLDDEGRMWFKKIEEGDEQAMAIFTWFKEITLKDTARVYDLLGVKFDSYAGESFYNDKMDRVIDELREKNLLVESQGAYVVDLEEEKMPPCLILKSDGATLYATRDIAAALYRADTYHFDKCLYVVAYQQNLHFKQWFKVVEKMGYPWAKDLEHVAFGMVSYEGQTLSTRDGVILYLEDLLEKAIVKAREIIEVKSPNLENKDEVARQVGIGAVVFYDLFNSRIKDIDFYWDRALNFDGETAPYVQYTHARCCSVLRKAAEQGIDFADASDYAPLCDAQAQAVLRVIDRLPSAVKESCQRNEPYVISRYCVELAQAYNRFYFEHQILTDDIASTKARLALTHATRRCIATAMGLLGIESPERM